MADDHARVNEQERKEEEGQHSDLRDVNASAASRPSLGARPHLDDPSSTDTSLTRAAKLDDVDDNEKKNAGICSCGGAVSNHAIFDAAGPTMGNPFSREFASIVFIRSFVRAHSTSALSPFLLPLSFVVIVITQPHPQSSSEQQNPVRDRAVCHRARQTSSSDDTDLPTTVSPPSRYRAAPAASIVGAVARSSLARGEGRISIPLMRSRFVQGEFCTRKRAISLTSFRLILQRVSLLAVSGM